MADRVHSTALALLIALGSGCEEDTSGEPMDPDALRPEFSVLLEEVFVPRCSAVVCHSITSHQAGLILVGVDAYPSLVDVEPDLDQAREAGFIRVDPGNVENSFLWMRLQIDVEETYDGLYGDTMPPNSAAVTGNELEAIRLWIENGALDD